MKRLLLFRARMLLELFGLGAFVYGFFSDRPLLTDIGGGILISTDIFFMLAGALHPGFPIIASIIGALVIDPWRYGVYWASAVFAFFSIPYYLIWLFRPPIVPDDYLRGQLVATSGDSTSQRVLPKSMVHFSLVDPPARGRNWAVPTGAVVVVVVAIIGGLQMAIGWQETGDPIRTENVQPTASVATETDVLSVTTPQPTATDNEPATWAHDAFANGVVEFDYPWDALVDADRSGYVELNTVVNGFALIWTESATGSDIGNIIATQTSDPNFSQRLSKFVSYHLSEQLEKEGGRITSIGEANVRRIGNYHVIVVDILLEAPQQSGTKPMSTLSFAFDCSKFTCEARYYKPGIEPFTPAEWEQVEHIISSIRFVD